MPFINFLFIWIATTSLHTIGWYSGLGSKSFLALHNALGLFVPIGLDGFFILMGRVLDGSWLYFLVPIAVVILMLVGELCLKKISPSPLKRLLLVLLGLLILTAIVDIFLYGTWMSFLRVLYTLK